MDIRKLFHLKLLLKFASLIHDLIYTNMFYISKKIIVVFEIQNITGNDVKISPRTKTICSHR
jgi:hypothetical protein